MGSYDLLLTWEQVFIFFFGLILRAEHVEITFVQWLVPLIVCTLLALFGVGIAVLYLRCNDCSRPAGDEELRLASPR